jgi:hydroxymethylbilane synthase
MILRIGTRGSKLALAQSGWIQSKIEARHRDVRVELMKIKTSGDKILDSPLSTIGGKGLFVKEIEEALLEERVDLAVHSMKDVPAALPAELTISTFPQREEPRDAFISVECRTLDELPKGARVGTSSLRRSAQLLHHRPDLEIVRLRGNVDTRLRKLESGELKAIILATAGLRRLGFVDRISEVLSEEWMLPAVGQGALGLEVRRGDERTLDLVGFLDHEETRLTVTAERAFLRKLEGGCQVPVAAFASLGTEGLRVRGLVAELDGSNMVKGEMIGPKDEAEAIGINLGKKLLAAGADRILARIYAKAGQC